jgi:tetratricopeptide (TPR) repeat protein
MFGDISKSTLRISEEANIVRKIAIVTSIILLALFLHLPLSADVLVLSNGERLSGSARPAPGNPDAILFQDSRGQVQIAKSRVVQTIDESDAQDWSRIGDQFLAQKKYKEALDAYNRSSELDSTNQAIAGKITAAQSGIQSVDAEGRRKVVADIDSKLSDAQESINSGDFEEAKQTLEKDIPPLKPTSAQVDQLKALRKALYLAWGKDQLDKLKPDIAGQYFEEVLRIDPSDKDAYNSLISIWSQIPEKDPQVIEAYRVQLKIDPEDNATRKNLAEKLYDRKEFAEAVDHYEYLFKQGGSRDSAMLDRIASALRQLYITNEGDRKYDVAIGYYKRLMAYDPSLTKDKIGELEFRKQNAEIPLTDIDARLGLAMQAKKQGLNELAQKELLRLHGLAPNHLGVNQALHEYAIQTLKDAQTAQLKQQYERAIYLAGVCLNDFGFFPDIAEQAQKLSGNVRADMEVKKRQNFGNAMKLKQLGDQYLQKAQGYINDMSRSTSMMNDMGGDFSAGPGGMGARRKSNSSSTISLVSNKSEAIRNLNLAVEQYQKALEYGSTLEEEDRTAISESMRTAKNYLTSLSRATPALPKTPKSRGYY